MDENQNSQPYDRGVLWGSNIVTKANQLASAQIPAVDK